MGVPVFDLRDVESALLGFLAGVYVCLILLQWRKVRDVTRLQFGLDRMIRTMIENATTAEEMAKIHRQFYPPKDGEADAGTP
jgi:hypothetical protein